MDAIRTSAKTALARCRDRYQDPLEFLDNLDWIYQDLILVEDQLDARFPPDWKVRRQIHFQVCLGVSC